MQQEVEDNLYLMVERFREVTAASGLQEDPIIMMDNIRIQANVNDRVIKSRYGTVTLPEGSRIRFPPHSPDINQVVEHSISAVKGGMSSQVFDDCAGKKHFNKMSLQRIFEKTIGKFETGQLFPRGVEHNFEKLPVVLEVISAPDGQIFMDRHGKTRVGSGGDWPNADER